MEPQDIDGSFVPAVRPEIGATDVAGELLIYDAGTGAASVLDPVGATVWSSFDGQRTLADISDELAQAYGAPADVVAHDVLALARSLAEAALLVGFEPPEPVVLYMEAGEDLQA